MSLLPPVISGSLNPLQLDAPSLPTRHPSMKNLGQILIRPAEAGDEDGILQCLAAAFEPYAASYTPEAYADTVLDGDALADRLRKMHVLVASSRGAIAGTVAGSLTDGEGHLRGMAVLPEYRGSGMAGMLLTAIEGWLKDAGCKRVTLDTTLPLLAAIKFYENNGYRRSGRIADFFGMPLVEYVKEFA
jgi:GNAT superfamily N-acetyltransferase